MTKEEKALVLDERANELLRLLIPPSLVTDRRHIEQVNREIAALQAGAAALRREGWKLIPEKPEDRPRIEPSCLCVGVWRGKEWWTTTGFTMDRAAYLFFTHYRELPAPPEGV